MLLFTQCIYTCECERAGESLGNSFQRQNMFTGKQLCSKSHVSKPLRQGWRTDRPDDFIEDTRSKMLRLKYHCADKKKQKNKTKTLLHQLDSSWVGLFAQSGRLPSVTQHQLRTSFPHSMTMFRISSWASSRWRVCGVHLRKKPETQEWVKTCFSKMIQSSFGSRKLTSPQLQRLRVDWRPDCQFGALIQRVGVVLPLSWPRQGLEQTVRVLHHSQSAPARGDPERVRSLTWSVDARPWIVTSPDGCCTGRCRSRTSRPRRPASAAAPRRSPAPAGTDATAATRSPAVAGRRETPAGGGRGSGRSGRSAAGTGAPPWEETKTILLVYF